MPTTTAEYTFAAEFATMAVSAAGVALVALRSRGSARGARRVVVAGGLLALAAAAFVAGAQLSGPPPAWLGAVRIAGAAAVLAGAAAPWTAAAGGRVAAAALRGSAALFAAAGAAEVAGAGAAVLDTALVVAAAALAAALLGISRRSVAASVAAGSAGTLAVVVLALSVALASVTTSSLQREQLGRLAGRAGLEAAAIAGQEQAAVRAARLAGVDLAGVLSADVPDPLVGAADGTDPGAAAAVGGRLGVLQAVYPVGGYTYVLPSGRILASAPAGAASAAAAAALPVGCGGAGRGGVVAAGGRLVVAAAFPECAQGSGRLLGRVLAVADIGGDYLAGRRLADPSASLALASPVAVLAADGPQPAAPTLRALAATQAAVARVDGGRVVAAQPVAVVAGPAVAVVASSPPTALDAARQRILRTLFVVALGGTVLALALVALVGDRITAGIRALTRAARRVQAGDTSTRAGVASANEVGVLGGSFDAMVVAIEDQNVALQRAADDEGRLRDRLQAIVAGMSDALVAVDAAGRVTETNPAAAELTGLDPAGAPGRPFADVVDLAGEDGAPLAPRLAHLRHGRWAATGTVAAPDRARVPVAVAAAALAGPAGQPAGAVVVLRDLRPEREVERMKTEFLSRAGHELRTPLTGILGYAELLASRGAAVEATRAAAWHKEILSSARRLARVVDMLEFFASGGAGRSPLAPEAVDVPSLLAAASSRWGERGGHIVRRVAPGTPAAMADRRWLARAVDELVDNAVKFSDPGGRVELSASAGDGGRWVAIVVSDRGKGMTGDERARAFAEFDQGDTSDTRAYGGLGLGLALVRQVVTEQGGSVECDTEPGRGTTFTIRLPAATA